MAQTTRTVNDLIHAAFNLIGEFAQEEPIDGVDFERAFDLLNLIIDHYSGEDNYIPITNTVKFQLQPGQQDYVFSNQPNVVPDVVSNRIAGIMYVNINYFNVFYPVKIITRTQIFDRQFNTIARTLPAYVLQENQVDRTILSFYNIPDQVYDCVLQAKFYLDKFEKFQPILNTPLSFQRFFIYALGRELISYYPSGNWAQTAEDTYQELLDDMMNTNDIDMSVRTSSILQNRYINYNGLYSNILGG